MQIGATYDIDQALKFGLNLKESLKRLKELAISPIRIGIKWNRVEEKKGKYRWNDYDEILNLLDSQSIPIILVLGMKSPQWPEYYIPNWLDQGIDRNAVISTEHTEIKDQLFRFVRKTLERYHNLGRIKCIQVENEPFFRFGPKKLRISKEFFMQEISFVKKLSDLPILLTTQGLPTTGLFAEIVKRRNKNKSILLKHSDIFGLNVFPKIRGKLLGKFEKIFVAKKTAWWYLQKWLDLAKGKNCWISELQAEPWGPVKLDFKDAYSDATCNPALVEQYLKKLKHLGFETVLIWGSEFHLACEKAGNSLWIDKIYREKNL